jgi:hypothetical protein
MMSTLSRVMVIAAVLALGVGTAAARGGHGGGGSSGGHGMSSGHGDHDGGRSDHDGGRGDHDRDDARSDDASNTGPCGMGWGWNDGRYCDEPSPRIGGGGTTQKAETPAKP